MSELKVNALRNEDASGLARRVLDDLAEDRATAWVADALGETDFGVLVGKASTQGTYPPLASFRLSVPRPGKAPMRVLCLPWPTHVRLHLATDPLRALADSTLGPTVCGYRRGAEPNSAYSEEYRRFRELITAERQNGSVVLYADVPSSPTSRGRSP